MIVYVTRYTSLGSLTLSFLFASASLVFLSALVLEISSEQLFDTNLWPSFACSDYLRAQSWLEVDTAIYLV